MNKTLAFIKKEFMEALPAIIFFLLIFHLGAFTKLMLLKDYQLTVTSSAVATIGALTVAKAILVVDAMSFANMFQRHPALFSVAWKTLLYSLITLVFRFLEEIIPILSNHGMEGAIGRLMAEATRSHFILIQVWTVASITMFCIAIETVDNFGSDKIRHLFLVGPIKAESQ